MAIITIIIATTIIIILAHVGQAINYSLWGA